jgi:hypothetical protein
MPDRPQNLSTFNTVILRAMQGIALGVGLITVIALASQFLGESPFSGRDLDWSEILILLAGNAFAWIVVAIFPHWARFVESIVRR